MSHSTRIATLPLLLIAASLLLVGCSGGGDPVAPDRRTGNNVTVRALMSHDPPSMSLLGKSDVNVETLAAQITDSLLQYDSEMRIVPRLAESWALSDDGRTLTFELRPGVRWHDGSPVTAEDVVFTVQQVVKPEVENRTFAPLFQDLESIRASGPGTVVARYARATPGVLEGWRVPILPRHLAEPGAELLTGEFSRHPIGCGPFKFVRFEPGQEIVLEANDDYWDGRPALDRLVFRISPDQRTNFQSLLAGELDTMVATPDLYDQALQSASASRLSGVVYYRLAVWQIVWNMDGSNAFFTDPRVRTALALALDRDRFNRSVVYGLARSAVTAYPPGMPWTDRTIEPLSFDPDEARRLLDAAGWRESADGVRQRNGRRFSFTLLIYSSTQRLYDHMAAWLQQSWADVGVEMQLEKLEWRQFRERRGAHQFDAAMGGINMTTSPDFYELYHSSAGELMNYGGLADPQVDELLEAGRRTFDPEARREIYNRLQARLFELQPAAWLFHFPSPVLYDSRIQGIHPSPIGHWKTSDGPRLWRWVETDRG